MESNAKDISTFLAEIDKQNLWTKTIVLDRNAFLKQAGQIDTNLYFVQEGSLKIFVADEIEESIIRFGYSNDIIAALDSFITEQTSDLCIQAIRKTSLKSISKTVFMNLVQSSIQNTKAWHFLLGDLIIQQMERERDLLTRSPIERYKRVLKRSPRLFQEIPNKYIASYLRMTPETLSRIKKS